MTFPEWQQLSPAEAAREVHHRIGARLSPDQQRAVIAALPAEADLATTFARASQDAPLGGVPYFLKDLFPVAGQAMFAGSTFLPEVRPAADQDSAIVRALRDAGGVLAGRTHLHEFAYGITGENPHYGDCEHPHFPGRTTGGSSSGSAAIVAAGIAPLAIGSDTGGSVRLPAAFCGLFGFRLTPRDVLISDAFPLAPSYDTAGWFTATAADMRAAIAALVGLDSHQATPTGCYLELPGLDPGVAQACRTAAEPFAPPADATTRAALLAAFSDGVDAYNTTVADEAWAVHHAWAERFRERYDPAVWQRLNRVHTLTPAQRASARHATAAIREAFAQYFRTFDFLILPASPFPALTKADCTLANRMRILALTAPASIAGLPVLTLPVPLPSGLSTGLQVILPQPRSPAVTWALAVCSSQPRH
jgi:amidase/aspartyl-tRNA(Asn)/glutamyl-tRNA(Gln) amidotransferase subunit A